MFPRKNDSIYAEMLKYKKGYGTSLYAYLQVIVERRDVRAGVVEDVCDPGWVVEVSVEELKVLSQAVPRGHPAAQPVVVIHDAPAAGASIVGPQ